MARAWVKVLCPLVDERSPKVPLARLLDFIVQQSKLRVMLGQLLVQLSAHIEAKLLRNIGGRQTPMAWPCSGC